MGLLIAQAMVQEGARVLLSCFDAREEAYIFDPGERRGISPIVWSSGNIRELAYCKTIVALTNEIFDHLDAVIDTSNFEFEQLWPGGNIIPLQENRHPPFNIVAENLYRAVSGQMAPGGAIIHIACRDPSYPVTAYPSFSSASYSEPNPEKELCEQGMRVITVLHEQVSALYHLNQFPSTLSVQQINQLFRLSQSLISILTEE